ncbi:hypothetical protein MMC16_007078 [Acarospora aff. strigata]|nr:hypothetical protein [Acarospora aff. strigata]
MVASFVTSITIVAAILGLSLATPLLSIGDPTTPAPARLEKRLGAPGYINFPANSPARAEIQQAWVQAVWYLIYHSGWKGRYDDYIFRRWFGTASNDPGRKAAVKAVFGKMVEENGGARDVWNDFRIDYNDYAHLCDESTDAYTNPLTAHQHFCPIFYEYPDLLELTCAELGDHISSRMDNAAGVVLHEATHVLHPPLSGVRFADMWHHQSLRQNWKGSHDRLGVSFHDYADGPTACVALALNNAPATLVNPDSYMWFTIENYFTTVCGRSYSGPRDILRDDVQKICKDKQGQPTRCKGKVDPDTRKPMPGKGGK